MSAFNINTAKKEDVSVRLKQQYVSYFNSFIVEVLP